MWSYVPSAFVQASEDSTSDFTPQDWSAFVTSSGTPTLRPSSWRGWATRPWIRLLSGLTLPLSTASRGAGWWISWLREHPASPSARQAAVERLRSISFPTPCGSSASANHGSCSSRTSRGQGSDSNSSVSSCKPLDTARLRLPKCPAPQWVHPTTESDSGYLPTPTAKANACAPSMRKWPAYDRLQSLTGPRGSPPIPFSEWLMDLPIGWTGFAVWETRLFPHKRSQPSVNS